MKKLKPFVILASLCLPAFAAVAETNPSDSTAPQAAQPGISAAVRTATFETATLDRAIDAYILNRSSLNRLSVEKAFAELDVESAKLRERITQTTGTDRDELMARAKDLTATRDAESVRFTKAKGATPDERVVVSIDDHGTLANGDVEISRTPGEVNLGRAIDAYAANPSPVNNMAVEKAFAELDVEGAKLQEGIADTGSRHDDLIVQSRNLSATRDVESIRFAKAKGVAPDEEIVRRVHERSLGRKIEDGAKETGHALKGAAEDTGDAIKHAAKKIGHAIDDAVH